MLRGFSVFFLGGVDEYDLQGSTNITLDIFLPICLTIISYVPEFSLACIDGKYGEKDALLGETSS